MNQVNFKPNQIIQPPVQNDPYTATPRPSPNPRQVAHGNTPQSLGGLMQNFGRGRAEAAGATQLSGLAAFSDLAGVKQEDHTKSQQKTLRQRQQTSVQQRSSNTRRRSINRLNVNNDDDEAPVKKAAGKALGKLREMGRHAFEQSMERDYDDPLQRYALLHNTLSELEERDMPAALKEELAEHLNSMLSDLMAKHRNEIRKGLQDQQTLAAAAQAMAGNTASLRELRFLYGAKGTGVFDSPLSAFAMAKALLERFGSDNFNTGMASLRGRMAPEFRVNPAEGMNARYWLCMTDAAAFNVVKSTFDIAIELRRDLIEKAAVMPATANAGLTVGLLGVVDGGKAKVASLLAQIYEMRNADAVTKGRVYEQVTLAVRKLADPMWASTSLRLEVIDELSKHVSLAYRGMPTLETGVERRERQWRERWAELKKSRRYIVTPIGEEEQEKRQGQGQEQDSEEGASEQEPKAAPEDGV